MKNTSPKIKTYAALASLWLAVCREAGVYEAKANKTRKKWMSRWTMAHKVAGTPEFIALHNALARAREIMTNRAVGAFIVRREGKGVQPVNGAAGRKVFYLSTDAAATIMAPIQDRMNKRNKGVYLAVFKHPEQDEKGNWVFLPKKSKKKI